ncbi:RNA polymerase sigma factor [Devosia ginsengisoli]|uniref:RNA polymerase sigma factor n=1 Tax=Devosia ginsengisoli TaxID=400770 RepID=A0A5B8LU13_9HYPH|nr:RNA polymerase sigma factor [Devosia ginsengisoli]QDZ11299.1 RNA polymerase sigma factor [Devosia ginsengisoli]
MGLTAAAPIEAAQAVTRALVVRAQNGDAEAFAELIEDHYDLIHRTAWKWCGNRADAEDVAQDVCVKLGGAIAGFDGRSAFSSWVYRITLNAVRDMQRAGKRRGKYADAYAEIAPEDQPAEQEEAATSRQLWAAVRTLPEKQRDAVLLVYAEELSHAAAAEIMGVREATVSWHVHEARKTLRGLL